MESSARLIQFPSRDSWQAIGSIVARLPVMRPHTGKGVGSGCVSCAAPYCPPSGGQADSVVLLETAMNGVRQKCRDDQRPGDAELGPGHECASICRKRRVRSRMLPRLAPLTG